MKIRSIELTNFRKFVGTVRVENIGDNVSVLVGRNELGKSTLLEAINAVIFEKAKSTAAHVKAYRHFVNGTVPEVKLTIDIDGKTWSIHKRFAGQPGKATLTCSDKRIFEDDAAEAELQKLLGFTAGSRGGEPGIWGTLWVQQGQSFGDITLDDQAQRTMQGCLEAQIGMVTGGARGKKIPKAVKEALENLQNSRGPRGRYKEAVDSLEKANEKIVELQAKRQSVMRHLEELAANKRDLKRAQEDWNDLDSQSELKEAREKRTAAALQAEEINTAVAAANLAQERADQARKASDERVMLIAELTPLENQLAELDKQSAAAIDARNVAKDAVDVGDTELANLRRKMNDIADRSRSLERARSISQIASEIDQHEATVAKSTLLDAETRELAEKIGAISATDATVTRIEEAQTELSGAMAAQNAVATAIFFDLHGLVAGDVVVEGQALDATKKAISILRKTTVVLKDMGTISIDPQINNHASLVKRQEAAEIEFREALKDAGAIDLSAARIAAAQRKEHINRSNTISKELAGLVPGNTAKRLAPGLDNLKSYLSQIRGRLKAEMESTGITTIPKESDLTSEVAKNHEATAKLTRNVEEAEAKLVGLREILNAADKTLSNVREQRATLSGKIESKSASLKVGRDSASDASLSANANTLESEAKSKRDQLDKKRTVQGETVEAIDARIRRLEGAIANHQRSVIHLGNEITRLKTLVEANEGAGVEEQLLVAEADKDRLELNVGDYKKEAAVLGLLSETLEVAEGEAKARYVAPVVSRVEPYLKMLLPGANIVLDEDLGISSIQRDGQQEAFAALSGGTREQLAILTRIAFAELLQRQGRPATVILDDALAFSDDDRIENMFDVLMRAGSNIQIIVLTCRKRLFSRLGASPIDIIEVD